MVTTILKGKKTIERTGTSGFTVTSVRKGDAVDVQIELDIATGEECQAMVGMLLAQLEELQGERFVSQCIAHYAEETGKQFLEEGGQKMFMIRGTGR